MRINSCPKHNNKAKKDAHSWLRKEEKKNDNVIIDGPFIFFMKGTYDELPTPQQFKKQEVKCDYC